MKRVLPHPILSVGLFVASILLSASVSPPSLLLAALAALLAPQIMQALRTDTIRLRNPGTLLMLTGLVVIDVLRSNWAVSKIILGGVRPGRTPGFVQIPLQLKDRYALAVLAIIITSTPGTLWVEYEPRTGILLLHVLDLVDRDEWVHLIKTRYERRLMEIFE